MQDFDDQHPRVRIIFGLVAVLIVIGGLWLASSFIWPEDNGQPVLLKADNTPFKTKPDDKGGLQIPHQDKLIFNTLSSDGKPITVERILPGPETPMNAPQANADPIVPTVVNQPKIEPTPQPVEPTKAAEKVQEKPVEKPAEKVPEKPAEKPVEKTAPLPTPTRTVDAPSAPAVAAPTVAAMGRIIEAAPVNPISKTVKPPAAFDMSKGADAAPVKKPEPDVFEKAEPVKEEAVLTTIKDTFAKEDEEEPVDAGPKSKARIVEPKKTVAEDVQEEAEPAEPAKKSSAGKGHFQIASFFDKPSADKALTQFKSKYADELDGAGLSIATATINGGKQVFRIQGTASSAAVASSICSGIKAKGGSCVTIK